MPDSDETRFRFADEEWADIQGNIERNAAVMAIIHAELEAEDYLRGLLDEVRELTRSLEAAVFGLKRDRLRDTGVQQWLEIVKDTLEHMPSVYDASS